MNVSDNTMVAEGVRDFFKNLGRKRTQCINNDGKNPRRALEIGAIVGSAFASPSPKAAVSSLSEIMNFCHTGKGLY